jgi:hypothetical protein
MEISSQARGVVLCKKTSPNVIAGWGTEMDMVSGGDWSESDSLRGATGVPGGLGELLNSSVGVVVAKHVEDNDERSSARVGVEGGPGICSRL